MPSAFTSSSNPTTEQVENLIEQKMGEIDSELKTSFHLSQSSEYRDLEGDYVYQSGIKVFLENRHIVTPLASASGDSLKVFNGSTWEEFVGSKTEARGSDFWIDERLGILHIKTGYWRSKYLGVDMTYRFNSGGRTAINDPAGIDASVTSVTVDDTTRFPFQGWVRIDSEEMTYTGKTATTLTGLTRGAFNTTAATHSDNAIVFWCPKDIEDVCTKMVAVDLLNSEDWSSGGEISGEMGSGQSPISSKIEKWERDIEAIFNRRRPVVVALR